MSGPDDATFPSIAVIDDVPWLAYLEKTGGVDIIYVERFDTTGGTWEQMGSPLNVDSTVSAFSPVIGAVGGVPHVAFREGAGSPQALYVKRYPIAPLPTSQVTITTRPPGLGIAADWTGYTAPQTFDWVVGTTHTIGTVSPQTRNDTLFVFSGWSDGGDTTHTIVVPDTNVTYTAIFGQILAHALIDSIVDVPGDQGGWVRVYFTRSRYDDADEEVYPIATYDIYRRMDDPALVAAVLAASPISAAAGEILTAGPEADRPDVGSAIAKRDVIEFDGRRFIFEEGLDNTEPPGMWEIVGNVSARQWDHYVSLVPTLGDSSQTVPYSVYFISAHTTTPSVFFDSPVDSGYSVDNIAPGVPQGFTVAYNTGSGNYLDWDPCADADFQYFKIYRGGDPDFTPSPENAVHSTIDTEWNDPAYDGWDVHYKVTALDYTGNESDPASPDTRTGVEGGSLPTIFALHQNVPNPFNPATVIRYDVPPPGGSVTIRIYDVAGRLVRTLVDAEQTAGAKQRTWHGLDDGGTRVATGVYFYRMTAPGFERTRKMVLVE